jgi:Tfp pilus assembly protein PilF
MSDYRTGFRVMCAWLIFLQPVLAVAQMKGHMLFGDLRVEEVKSPGIPPMNFVVTLYWVTGNVFGRDNVPANGRYRFLDVPNGEYELVVETQGTEVARIHMLIHETGFADIRRDVQLQWKPDAPAGGKAGTVSTASFYKRSPENSALFEQALQQSSGRNYAEGISLLRRVTAADPKDYEAWCELGTMQFLKGEHSDANHSYRRALDQQPGYFVALLNLGKLLVVQKNYEEAIPNLLGALKQQPQSAEANYYLGEAFLQVRKGSIAVGYLNEAIRLDPIGKAEAHLRLAALYNAARMKDRAAAEYEQFLKKKPDYPERGKLEEYIRSNRK